MKRLVRLFKVMMCRFCVWRIRENKETASYARSWGSNNDEWYEYVYRATIWKDRLEYWQKSLGN